MVPPRIVLFVRHLQPAAGWRGDRRGPYYM